MLLEKFAQTLQQWQSNCTFLRPRSLPTALEPSPESRSRGRLCKHGLQEVVPFPSRLCVLSTTVSVVYLWLVNQIAEWFQLPTEQFSYGLMPPRYAHYTTIHESRWDGLNYIDIPKQIWEWGRWRQGKHPAQVFDPRNPLQLANRGLDFATRRKSAWKVGAWGTYKERLS